MPLKVGPRAFVGLSLHIMPTFKHFASSRRSLLFSMLCSPEGLTGGFEGWAKKGGAEEPVTPSWFLLRKYSLKYGCCSQPHRR